MKTSLFCFLLYIVSIGAFAQIDKDNQEALAKMDTTALKGKSFLNKSTISQLLIETFRSKQ